MIVDSHIHVASLTSFTDVHLNVSCYVYCKTLNVSVIFISRISRAKQNREIKGREYQLQAKMDEITTVFRIVWL